MPNSNFIKLFLQGTPTILNNIYKSNFRYVKYYILNRNGSLQDAQDVFNNALLTIFIKLKNEDVVIESFDNYFFTICINLWRKECSKKRYNCNFNINIVSEDVNPTFYLLEKKWCLYKEKFDLLPKQCQEILKMTFEKKSYEEIVDYYSYASTTVARQRVFKCRKKLEKLIKEDTRFTEILNEHI